MDFEPPLDAALEYARQGLPVFPCNPLTKAPLTDNGFYDATTDESQIRFWWTQWPNAMIGIRTGEISGIWAIDPDAPKENIRPDGQIILSPDGREALKRLQEQHGQLPATHTHITPSGGLHHAYAWDPQRPIKCSAGGLTRLGIQVRGQGGYIIAPPSLNTKLGTAYRHADPKYKFKFAVAPDWLYDIILKEKQSAKDKGTEEPPHRPNGRPRQSNAYGLAALQDECNKLSAVPPGERNGQLFLSAIRMGQLIAGGHLAYGVACHELYQAAVANGLDKDYAGPQGVRKTIESGMRRGLNEPRTLSGSYGSSYTGSGPDEVDDPLGEWDAGDDDVVPPPRGWLLGNIFCRQFCSSLLGEGAIGKTAVRYCHYLSLAAGKSLTGEHVFQRSRVLIVSLEDGVDELRRRLRAVCLHYGLRLEDLRGYLFLAAPGASVGKLMHANGRGAPIPGKLIEKLSQVIVARKIDLVGLDPYVKTHGMPENDNTAMDKVAQVLTDLAIKHNVAVDCPHHISKGPSDPGNANRGRGASATKDAFRLVHTLAGMSREEAEGFGISEAERRFLVRMDSGKVNMAPPEEASWFKLVGVRIDNGTELYPSGDEVQTVEQWIPPKCFDGISNALANQILTAIDKGLPNGQRYSDAPKADDRAAWKVVTDHVQGKTEAQGRRVIGTWRKSGLLIIGDYDDPVTRKRVKGLSVDDTKRPS